MASIRRSLSPYRDRHNQNGTSPFAESSPQLRHGKSSSEGLRRVLVSALMGKYPKRSPSSWKRSLARCLLFFLCGFLLGMTPFGQVNDLQANDISFEFKSSRANAQVDLSTDRPTKRSVYANANITHVVQLHEALVELNPEDWGLTARKQLIVVTPTYNRAFQAYFLNRVSQVLRLVQPPLLWIVVEMNGASTETADILRKSKVMYRHLVCTKNMTDVKDRGVHQRNTALEHIRLHQLDGIVYFADDDNIYSLELFENMRRIRRFGTWPVAMLAPSKSKAILEGPVCNGSQVIGWHTNEKSKRLRRFHVDMSGFAFNSTILWDPKRWRRPTRDPIRQLDTVKEGFQETTFIEQVVEDESQMEATLPSCSTIMNWHLHLDAHNVFYPKGWQLEKNLDSIVS